AAPGGSARVRPHFGQATVPPAGRAARASVAPQGHLTFWGEAGVVMEGPRSGQARPGGSSRGVVSRGDSVTSSAELVSRQETGLNRAPDYGKGVARSQGARQPGRPLPWEFFAGRGKMCQERQRNPH